MGVDHDKLEFIFGFLDAAFERNAIFLNCLIFHINERSNIFHRHIADLEGPCLVNGYKVALIWLTVSVWAHDSPILEEYILESGTPLREFFKIPPIDSRPVSNAMAMIAPAAEKHQSISSCENSITR